MDTVIGGKEKKGEMTLVEKKRVKYVVKGDVKGVVKVKGVGRFKVMVKAKVMVRVKDVGKGFEKKTPKQCTVANHIRMLATSKQIKLQLEGHYHMPVSFPSNQPRISTNILQCKDVSVEVV